MNDNPTTCGSCRYFASSVCTYNPPALYVSWEPDEQSVVLKKRAPTLRPRFHSSYPPVSDRVYACSKHVPRDVQ